MARFPFPEIAVAAGLALSAVPVAAQSAAGQTDLLDLYTGSSRSSLADNLSDGGYELSGGGYVDFDDWYVSDWTDTTILFLTALGGNAGLIWGVSTGERGPKYEIQPAFHAGLIFQIPLHRQTWLTVTATAVFGGTLTEQSCTADYGEIGGVQEVNCRLAAEPIPPAETLRYLARQSGHEDSRITLSVEHRF